MHKDEEKRTLTDNRDRKSCVAMVMRDVYLCKGLDRLDRGFSLSTGLKPPACDLDCP